MSKIIKKSLLLAFLALPLAAQTTLVAIDQLRWPVVAAPTLVVFLPPAAGSTVSQMQLVALGAGLRLNTATNPPTIEAIAVAPPVAPPAATPDIVETFKLASAATSHTLRATPTSPVQVTRNGVVLAEGHDYTIAGRIVTFTAARPGPGDLMQFRFR